jgi:TolB protein
MHLLLIALVSLTAWTLAPAAQETAVPQFAARAPRNGRPSVSPDGRWIAFVSDRMGGDDIFVIGVDGRGERQMTFDGGGAPCWTRNSEEILFVGEGPDTCHVMAVSLEGGKPEVVATVSGRQPMLSRDGKRVLFNIGSWRSTILAVSNLDGSGLGRLAGGDSVTGGTTTAWNGAWSPDGTRVAYTHGDSTGILQVHVVNADGTGDRTVTRTTAGDGSAQMPAWAPDGKRLAVQVNKGSDGPAHIWIVDVATTEARKLNLHTGSYLDETPAWFPDGKRLAFQSNRSGRMEVWVMRDDGSEARRVTGGKQ